MKSNVWVKVGIVIIYGASIDASSHAHHAIQVVWPKERALCLFEGQEVSGPLIINSDVAHQLQMKEGWILLVEPTSNLGMELSQTLAGQPFKTSDFLFTPTYPFSQEGDLPQLLAPLFHELKLKTSFSLMNQSMVADKRIQKLLLELQQCLAGECLKPTHWRASEVAQTLALSESRFLHLFREELGIPWRPYLLWCRMTCAMQAILNHSSATDAAHIAGFSDSAHLSRTFRKTFGMTIRQANAIFKQG